MERSDKSEQEPETRAREQARAAAKTFEKNFPRQSSPLPFPLPDIYDDDDPHLVRAALGGIRDYRRFCYMPGLGCNGSQLAAATDVALDVRAAWSAEELGLRKVPSAQNPDSPIRQDFIELEQWFSDASAAIAKEIANGSAPKADTKEQSPADDTPDDRGFVKSPSDKSAYMTTQELIDKHGKALKLKSKRKELGKILQSNPRIRRWKVEDVDDECRRLRIPKRAYCIHRGDWQAYVDQQTTLTKKALEEVSSRGFWTCRKCKNVFEVAPEQASCPSCGSGDIAPVMGRPK